MACHARVWREPSDAPTSGLLGSERRMPELQAMAAAETSAESPLSRREQDVAVQIARGLTNREIGQTLAISGRPVESFLRQIRRILGVLARAQIAVWVAQRGL